jgi:hypothetical protein
MTNKSKKKDIKKKEDYKIYPLNVDLSKLNEVEKYPLCDVPHLILINGRVKAGKSVIINNLYLNYYKNDFECKILISPSAYNDAMNQHLLKEFDFIFTEYSDDLIDELLEMIKKDTSDDRFLLVLDDIVGSNAGSRRGKADKITSLSTIYRHLGNEEKEGKLSICIATQYFKHITPILRNQASGVYICGHYTDNELKKIAEAYAFFGGSEKDFIQLFRKAKQEPHDFLFLNVNSMEARRNHDEILWTYDDFIKGKTNREDNENKEINKNISNNNKDVEEKENI